MSDIHRVDQNSRRSRAVVHGGLVFIAGQVADDKGVDVATQTKQVLAKIDDVLGQAGSDKGRLLTAQIWLSSMANFDRMNAVWDAWLMPGQAPARCCGEVKLADPGYLVEIVVTAAASSPPSAT